MQGGLNSDLTLSLLNQNNEIVSTAHCEICLTAYEILTYRSK